MFYVYSVRFPGAIDSKFTTDMSFINPSEHPAIPTYRVMDSDGVIVDKSRGAPDVKSEEVITWYKNMLTGMFSGCWSNTGWDGQLIWTFWYCSEHYGLDHVRCTKTRTIELLHGTLPLANKILISVWNRKSDLAIRFPLVRKE